MRNFDINADMLRGIILGREYQYSIMHRAEFIDTIRNVFDGSFEQCAEMFIDDIPDNIWEEYGDLMPNVAIPTNENDIDAYVDEYANAMMNAIETDEFVAMLANAYRYAYRTIIMYNSFEMNSSST